MSETPIECRGDFNNEESAVVSEDQVRNVLEAAIRFMFYRRPTTRWVDKP